MGTYLLLDGHSLAYRAWFALQESGMKTAGGQETQAVYGFVSMTTRLLTDFRPDGMAVAFDRPEPTFRDAIASDYKAGRAKTPDPLVSQIELIRQFVDALGVPNVDALGFEADDVLATLAAQLKARGDDVIIVTGDRDAYQLVSDPHVRVLYNRRGVTDYVLYDEAGIVERTGVPPSLYPLLASLRGDPSDNLPGVPGVGEKTAAKLVDTYRDIDAIFANLDALTPKLRASLAACEAQVRQNLQMSPLIRDVPLEVDLDDLAFAHTDRDALDALFSFLEMRTPRERLFAAFDALGVATENAPVARAEASGPARTYALRVLGKATEAADYLREAHGMPVRAGQIAIEPVFSGAPGRSSLEGIAFGVADNDELAFVPQALFDTKSVRSELVALLGGDGDDENRRIVAFRAKELMRTLLEEGIDLRDLDLDVAVAAYVVDPALGQATLGDLASARGLALDADPTESSGQLGLALDGEAESSAADRAMHRAALIGELATLVRDELDAVDSRSLYEEIERPLVRVLARMEVVGIGVDVERLRTINSDLTNEVRALEGAIHGHAGETFNVNSTPQLRKVLFETLALKPQKKTKTGYSTDAQSLEKLRDEHPIVEALIRYREVEKLRSTYGEGLIAEVASDGRIHASFNQTVARTGRLSSDQPNLHNIPVRTDEGRRFREAFVPAPGKELLIADYNQIELRVIAHLSDDPGLVDAFASGQDIHNATAARLFGVAPDKVTSPMRSKAKMVSYGLAYGMEAYGLSQRLAVPVDEAAAILDQYFSAFPAVRAYMDATVIEARRRGYTMTERGRRRYLPELASDNFRVRQAAERQAMNSGIQGLAADIFKIALVRLDDTLERQGLASRVVLQVHDEVLVEAEPSEHALVEALTLDAMCNAYPLKVPLEVHLTWGTSWADAK